MRWPAWMAVSASQPMLTSIMISMPPPIASRIAFDVLDVLAPRPDVRDLHLDRLQALRGELLGAGDHAVAAEAAETARAVGRHLGARRAPQAEQGRPARLPKMSHSAMSTALCANTVTPMRPSQKLLL